MEIICLLYYSEKQQHSGRLNEVLKVTWLMSDKVGIETQGYFCFPWLSHSTASFKPFLPNKILFLCIAFSSEEYLGRENVTFTCQRSCWEIYRQRGKGSVFLMRKEELKLSKLGNIIFTLVSPLVPAPCWSRFLSLIHLLPICTSEESPLIFHKTQHLLSVPALQLIISMYSSL